MIGPAKRVFGLPYKCFGGEQASVLLLLLLLYATCWLRHTVRWMSIAAASAANVNLSVAAARDGQTDGRTDGQYHYCVVYGPCRCRTVCVCVTGVPPVV